ncbi:MAG: cupin domain-containing protein [Dokdonella sp.]|uniref:cupin domain-containing protein n=1 Tax=Dokdonella sp. TaxID=2291710 RepID=UPI003267D68A
MIALRACLIVSAWLLVDGVARIAYAGGPNEPGIRLTAQEIAALPEIIAGPGTSGVAGIRSVILEGNPLKDGPYTIALLVPANTRIAAHTHRDSRSVVVVSGEWSFGYGETANDSVKKLGPGGFYTEPSGVAHFARTGDKPVTVYISGAGPTDTRYVDTAASTR